MPAQDTSADLDLVFDFMREQPNARKLIAIVTARMQLLENATAAILTRLSLANADGWWLDRYGLLLDLRRRIGWDDNEYRFFLRAKILALRSSGTAPQLMALARWMAGPDTDPALVRFFPQYPMGYLLTIPNVDSAYWDLATELVSIATMAGVRGVLVYYSPAETLLDYFAFQPPGNVHGLGAGHFAHSEVIIGV